MHLAQKNRWPGTIQSCLLQQGQLGYPAITAGWDPSQLSVVVGFHGQRWTLTSAVRVCVPVQPMRCLCEAKVCRGFIGGTGEAVMSQEQELEDPADASEDPEPIMVEEKEAAEPALVAILESEVGLASEYWDGSAWRRSGLTHHCPVF